ncbi:DsbE family thiol:disulfide interchange protein [Roseovarius sp. SCSIO 43702]|uniref:DsbE family thiol:disulfide interchange protein n=1 Tax=Roseovarius sp. SCSIO 43702 TaxID=2823043 RepID=UPI001C72AB58|nr:DsbE family thiol:disulfide interchange protein [Roseovarius sp. SCSIO 43702]QYX57906.1 DsbE family thiol:disulfide interchange protein [Roseovarius sp. SCSIO 43702]
MSRISPLMIAPPLIFVAIAVLFYLGMQREDPNSFESVIVGRKAPPLPEDGLPGRPVLTADDLRGNDLTVVNFWASWCPPCRAEHPTLEALSEEGFRVAGVNFKDTLDQADQYLEGEGDPFFAHGFDPKGRAALDWGVTAPPETFIVDAEGTVLFRFAGPLVGSDYEQRFRPALEEALGAQ